MTIGIRQYKFMTPTITIVKRAIFFFVLKFIMQSYNKNRNDASFLGKKDFIMFFFYCKDRKKQILNIKFVIFASIMMVYMKILLYHSLQSH